VHEGVAELAAEKFDGGGAGNDHRIQRLARGGGLASWDEIADYKTALPERKMLAYWQGHHMVGYISDRWGREKRNAWLRRMGSGDSLAEATRGEFGVSLEDLDRDWRATLLPGEEGK
jgi:hypothetical protein